MHSVDPVATNTHTARIPFLDHLRSAAILLVMLHHFRWLDGAPEWFRWFALRGGIGVDLFFVLSGWLIGGALFRELRGRGRIGIARFWMRRWLRTLPAYYVMMVVYLLAHDASARVVLSMLVFVQNYTVSHSWYVTWSLCVEEHFYIVLPIGMVLLARGGAAMRPWKILVVAATIAASPVLRFLSFDSLASMDYHAFITTFYAPTHYRTDGLMIGVALAALKEWDTASWRMIARWSTLTGIVGFILVVACTWNPYWSGFASASEERMAFFNAVLLFTLVSLGAGCLICAGVARFDRGLRDDPPFLGVVSRWTADHAYALYLTHMIARDGVRRHLPGADYGFVFPLMVGFVVSAMLAVALRRWVELPGLRLRQRIQSLSEASSASSKP